MALISRLVNAMASLLGRMTPHIPGLQPSAFSSSFPEHVARLKKEIAAIPVQDAENCCPSEKIWKQNMNELRQMVLSDNPGRFLNWDVILKTMFVGNARYIMKELSFLQKKTDWADRWKGAIRESAVGAPVPFLLYPRSSGNLIHQAYHLSKFEDAAEIHVTDIDFVFEFGGGYGSMCRLFYNMDFRGKYIIHDLPMFSSLQKFFLNSLGLPLLSEADSWGSAPGILCISEITELRKALERKREDNIDLFIGTWSLSETPEVVRREILRCAENFRYFLIGYQDHFGEMDNVRFFETWRHELQNKIQWEGAEIGHLPGSHYLFGKRE